MPWVPKTDFEEEIVSLQPNHNFIFGTLSEQEPEVAYPRPKSHLDFVASQKHKKKLQQHQKTNENPKLKIIAKVQSIVGKKPLGTQPTVEDWDTNDGVEEETIAMMRHFGIGPSIEQPLDESLTLPTLPITDDMFVMRNGNGKTLPVFFDEKFFKLKPRISKENLTSGTSQASCESSDFNSAFEMTTDPELDASFTTAVTTDQFIASRSWYRRRTNGNNRNSGSSNLAHSSSSSSVASSVSAPSSSLSQTSAPISTPRQYQQLYTTKQLYEKKRNAKQN